MKRRFPRDVEPTFSKLKDGSGYSFEIRWADGTFIADGQSAGNKTAAREAAWRALEETGVVTDGVT
jgi:hypothetical protein